MTEPDLKHVAIDLLTLWLPADELARKKHVAEVVGRLWTCGLKGMIDTACSLAATLHLLDNRITCHLHLSGFEKSMGMIGLICAVDRGLIVPGCLALWGDATDPASVTLTPAELQDDLGLAKPAGAEPVPLKDVTPAQLKAVVARLVELADGPAKPKRRSWWGRLWGPPGGKIN